MGKKKKGLANRLAKMTDEERARYLQHRADIEEENRRRKEQLISTFLKNKIGKEDGFARLNVAKINQNWHQILRKLKCKEMKENVEHLKLWIDNLLELKNRTIEKVLVELEDAEEQYTNNLQSHMIWIDNFIDFGNKSLEEMHDVYEKDCKEFMENAKLEKDEYLKKAYEEQLHLKTIIYCQGNTGKKELREQYEYYLQKTDDILRENNEEFEEMRVAKEAKIHELWRNISQVLRNYVERTDLKRAHLAELTTLDAESAEEIVKNEKNIKRCQTELKKLEAEFEKLKKSQKEELKSINDAVESLRKEHLQIKIQHKKELDFDVKQLLLLSNHSNDSLTYLQNLFTKGEKILQLMQVCRKLETQKEKVLRFNNTTNEDLEDVLKEIQEDERKIKRRSSSSASSTSSNSSNSGLKRIKAKTTQKITIPKNGIINETFEVLQNLDNFWINFNKVKIESIEMKNECKELMKENEKMKETIRNLLEEIALEKVADRLNVQKDLYIREIHSAPICKPKSGLKI